MPEEQNKNKKLDIVFLLTLLIMIISISLFNYIVDPYFIFKDSSIKGFNDVKTHKYTNKRTILYSDIKINSKKINSAFVGNCIIARPENGKNDIAFYTIPIAKFEEVEQIIKNIHNIAPQIKKIYWGLFFQDLWHDQNDLATGTLPELENSKITLNDYVNLFFSWNTTNYSIETIKDSIKKQGKEYIYPYKEIAVKSYEDGFTFESMKYIEDAINYAKNNGIEVIVYYSPMHITKKMHIYENNAWDKNIEFKKRLAQITPFYDYSLNNEYNMSPLDENSIYFIDNIHLTDRFNNIIIEDLLSNSKEIGVLITKDNVDAYTKDDTQKLTDFINNNKDLAEQIKNVKKEDAEIKILKKSL